MTLTQTTTFSIYNQNPYLKEEDEEINNKLPMKINGEYHNPIVNIHYVLVASNDVIMANTMKKLKKMKVRKILGNVHYVANNRRFKCSNCFNN
jgi:hypothetical protein